MSLNYIYYISHFNSMQSTMEEISRIKEITSNVKHGCLTKHFW